MNKLLLAVLCVFSFSAFAEKDLAVLTSETPYDKLKVDTRKSHWLTTFGFEGMKYDAAFSNYNGDHKDFGASSRDLWGARLGVGGSIYLGNQINTTTLVEGYYAGTLFSQILNGGPEDEDLEFAYTKKTSQIWGVTASQQLGFMFDMKTKNPFLDEWSYLTVEPYVMAGIGFARAYNSINYSYSLAGTNDRFKESISDELTNLQIGVGMNFTATNGFFFYTRVTQNRYDLNSRDIETKKRESGDPAISSTSSKDNGAKIDPITVFSVGGGYKF
ncbi:hypothetical protein ACJVC5_02250 [Peredibacter sp. HCB2-198]|uniref:hypothetical protein n=1 Tax=Peredibacter sp. HCB2-198 TaxID=3383025 RepID=UPI0038B6AC8E